MTNYIYIFKLLTIECSIDSIQQQQQQSKKNKKTKIQIKIVNKTTVVLI